LGKTAAITSKFGHHTEEETSVSATKAETEFAPTVKLQKAKLVTSTVRGRGRGLLCAELN